LLVGGIVSIVHLSLGKGGGGDETIDEGGLSKDQSRRYAFYTPKVYDTFRTFNSWSTAVKYKTLEYDTAIEPGPPKHKHDGDTFYIRCVLQLLFAGQK
jgi:hypothetical protein